MKPLSDPDLEVDLRAAHDWLKSNGIASDSPVAAVGFCMGGRAAFSHRSRCRSSARFLFMAAALRPASKPRVAESGERCDRAGAALLGRTRSAYSRGTAKRGACGHRGLCGSGQEELCERGVLDADHGFFCDARPSYNVMAAKQSWPLTLAFLGTYTAREQRATA